MQLHEVRNLYLEMKNNMKKTIVIALLSLSLFGRTYEIVEPHLIDEIKSKEGVFQENYKKQREDAFKKVDEYKGVILNKATVSKINFVDPTYTLENDIPKYNRFGQAEGILYKKGYKFNPLQYIKFTPPDLIVFNVCDKDENKYIKELLNTRYKDKENYMLVNSGCPNNELKKTDFNRKVYFLTQEMVDKFHLKNTVSIVSVDLAVKKIKIEEVKTNK